MIRALLILLLCVSTSYGVGYENAARINASGYQVFGVDLPATLVSTAGYTHNHTTWPGSVWDFSGCPLCINNGSVNHTDFTGALITPRHLLVASHAYYSSGTVYFVTPAGSVVSRTISTASSLIGSDIRILTLNSAATGCAVYKLPTSGSLSALSTATIWCLDKPRTVVSRQVTTVGSNIVHAADSTGGSLVDGDSGQPAFVTRGGELVLLGTHYMPTLFPSAGAYLTEINAFCDDVGEAATTISIDPATWTQPLNATGALQR